MERVNHLTRPAQQKPANAVPYQHSGKADEAEIHSSDQTFFYSLRAIIDQLILFTTIAILHPFSTIKIYEGHM